MQLILHVGVHKTGTSALQAFLHKNRDHLRGRGFWYDTPPGHLNHTSLAQAFKGASPHGPKALEGNVRAAQSAGCHTCIISSEAFVEHPFNMDEFKGAVDGLETTVIAYIRQPDEVVLSAHNELVKNKTSRWTTTIAERLPYDPTYRAQLSRWMNGSWRFVLAPYDKAQWPDRSLFADFLSMIGVDPVGFDMAEHKDLANRSLPPALIEVLRIANRLDLSEEKRAELIAGLFEVWDRRPDMYAYGSLLAEEEREDYRAQFARHIETFRPYFREGFDERFLLPKLVPAL